MNRIWNVKTMMGYGPNPAAAMPDAASTHHYLYHVRVHANERTRSATRPSADRTMQAKALESIRTKMMDQYIDLGCVGMPPNVWMEAIHLCETTGCIRQTPYPHCRIHDSEQRAVRLGLALSSPALPTVARPATLRPSHRRLHPPKPKRSGRDNRAKRWHEELAQAKLDAFMRAPYC